MKKSLLSCIFIMLVGLQSNVSAQTIIASWSFDALLAPTTDVPTANVIQADYGSSTSNSFIYLDGTNGSSTWVSAVSSPELTAFSGSTLNDPRPSPTAGMALALANNTANGKSLVIKFSTLGLSKIKVLFATRGTSTGFDTHSWEWSTDNVTYTACGTNSANKTSTWSVETVDLTSVEAVNNAATVYLRLTLTGATSGSGNNRIDNLFIIEDSQAPSPDFNPTNSANDVAISVTPTVTFNEAVRKPDGSELTDADLALLITFKKTDATGENVAFTATIDGAKKVITVTPASNLENSQVYYLAIGPVEDGFGNESTASSITFTTASAASPTITLIYPAGGETFYAGQEVTITWDYANITNVKTEAWAPDDDGVYSWVLMAASTPASDKKLDYTIPEDAPYATELKVRVSDADNPSVYSESSNFTLIASASSLSVLRARYNDGALKVNDVIRLNSEAIITFKASSANIYIQDAGAGILIYDNGGKLTTPYNQYDGITGLTGSISVYSNILEIVPKSDPGSATSTGNTVTPVELTAASLNTDYDTYESMLVKIKDVTFADAGSSFASGASYNITDASGTTIFYTKFSSADYIGTTIPAGSVNVTGICMQYGTAAEVASRNLLDIELAMGIEKRSLSDKIKLYPVPATSVLNITGTQNLKSIDILDIAGKVIRTINTSTDEVIRIPVSNLKPGTYMLRFSTKEGTVIKQFVR